MFNFNLSLRRLLTPQGLFDWVDKMHKKLIKISYEHSLRLLDYKEANNVEKI